MAALMITGYLHKAGVVVSGMRNEEGRVESGRVGREYTKVIFHRMRTQQYLRTT